MNPFHPLSPIYPTDQEQLNHMIRAREAGLSAQPSLGQIIGSFMHGLPMAIAGKARAGYHGPGIPLGKLAPYLKNILR